MMDMLKEVLYNKPNDSLYEYVKDEFGNIVPRLKEVKEDKPKEGSNKDVE